MCLEASRENDGRVAEAMGWRWWTFNRGRYFRTLLLPELAVEVSQWGGWVGAWDGDEGIPPEPDCFKAVPVFTANAAHIPAMMERTAELGDGHQVELHWVPFTSQWLCKCRGELATAPTANLAICTVLLAVWRAKGKEVPRNG